MQKVKTDIIRFIRDLLEIDLSVFDETFFIKSLRKRMEATKCKSMADYNLLLKTNRSEAEILAGSMNITYSEFFRNPLVFDLLQQTIFPDIFFKKKKSGWNEIRIWSAAAAAGQEVYSLAMILDHLKMSYQSKIQFHVFASDICQSEIEKAKTGFYPAEQLQNLPLKYLNKYFYSNGDGYKLIPHIREMVDFFAYDILDTNTISPPDSIYGSFDLIYCSNVLIYYNPEIRNRIIQKLLKNLDENGFLITGESERELFSEYSLHAVCRMAPVFQAGSTQY